MHLVGAAGSFADRRRVREGQVQLPSKVVTVARHLASHLGKKASFVHELPRRRQAVMTAFFSCLFISRVVNTALSGIEAFCPSKAQYQALTSSRKFSVLCFLETGTLRRGGSCVKTPVGADAGAEPCTSCAADHSVVRDACGTASCTRGKRISPDANPWAARWAADLRELEPFDERELFNAWAVM